MQRTRTRLYAAREGSFVYSYGTPSKPAFIYGSSFAHNKSVCIDYPGPYTVLDGPLDVDHVYQGDSPISGVFGTKTLAAFQPLYFCGDTGIGHLADDNRPSNPTLAVSTLSKTNPNRPIVDLPVTFAELRELPDVVYSAGHSYLKTYAKRELQHQFGWAPLVGDFMKLMKFRKALEDRVKLFKKLEKSVVCRKVQLYRDTVFETPGNVVVTNSSPAQAYIRHVLARKTTSRRVWGYVRWRPNGDTPKSFQPSGLVSSGVYEREAYKVLLGLDVGPSTLWEALPWSWLADWYGNIGDYLGAHRSTVSFDHDTPVICETTKTSYNFTFHDSNITGLTSNNVVLERVSKTRLQVSASFPSVDMPLFTQRHVNIIASLAVLRSRF